MRHQLSQAHPGLAMRSTSTMVDEHSPDQSESEVLSPEPRRSRYRYLHIEGNSWEEVMSAVNKYYIDLCESWNHETDSAVVFAGLFSATITPFIIESYRWLSEDSSKATICLLSQLSQHLGTANVPAAYCAPFEPTAEAVRINIFWFLSLVIALSTALIGILCKQWIREYQRSPSISNEEAFKLRQLRHESWESWRVPEIIRSTSLLLQVSLLLFFAGIVDLLWSQAKVTIITTVVAVAAGLSTLFMLLTIILPSCYDRIVLPNAAEWNNLIPCAYRSPLSRVLLSLLRSTIWSDKGNKLKAVSDWASVDLHIIRHSNNCPSGYLSRGLVWAVSTLSDNIAMIKTLFRCLESSSTDTPESLVPAVLGYPSPTNDPGRLPQIYRRFLQSRSYEREMLHFYIEVTLICLGETKSPSHVSWLIKNISILLEHEEDIHNLPRDLYLEFILIFSRFTSKLESPVDRPLIAILEFGLPLLMFAWVHADKAVCSAGARWAAEMRNNISSTESIRRIVLKGLGSVVYGDSDIVGHVTGQVVFSEETRRRIISSEPFHGLIKWAWPEPYQPEWHAVEIYSPSFRRSLLDDAQKFAELPLSHFRDTVYTPPKLPVYSALPLRANFASFQARGSSERRRSSAVQTHGIPNVQEPLECRGHQCVESYSRSDVYSCSISEVLDTANTPGSSHPAIRRRTS